MWKPDGRGSRARIGVLTPHLDPVPESEIAILAPDGVSVHTARVPLGMVVPDGDIVPSIGSEVARAFSEPPHVDNAVSSLMPLKPSAIIYAFTSSSYILGSAADERMRKRLVERAGGTPVVVQTQALGMAASALGAERVALFHPPWYSLELDQLGVEYFSAHGFDVTYHGRAELRSDYGDIDPERLVAWITKFTPDNADLVIIGGGGFRAIGAIGTLESELSRPVISANQASLWVALREAKIDDDLPGYGRLYQISQ